MYNRLRGWSNSRVELQTGAVGDNVAVPIPMVDRGRGDARLIVHRDVEKNQHKFVVKIGVLKGQCSRNQLDLCLNVY
jgi:hypothetical protein